MVELFANSEDPDQTPRSVASDQGLHCFLVTRLESPVFNGLRCLCEVKRRPFFQMTDKQTKTFHKVFLRF